MPSETWVRLVVPQRFLAALAYPPDVDPSRFHLVARYERDPSRWLRMRWVNRYDATGRTYAVTTGPRTGDLVGLKSFRDVIADYRGHPESKSLGPDGRPCGRETAGLLRRRPVHAANLVYIGKEANDIDDVEAGLVHDVDDVLVGYGPSDDPWVTDQLPLIQSVPTGLLAKAAGVDRKTVQRTKAGITRPRPETERRLYEAATMLSGQLRSEADGPRSSVDEVVDRCSIPVGADRNELVAPIGQDCEGARVTVGGIVRPSPSATKLHVRRRFAGEEPHAWLGPIARRRRRSP